MEDKEIIDLYLAREERAIQETDGKYGKYCFTIANNILESPEDSQECVSDTYLAAWNNIPPRLPAVLATFLGKITRNISLNRWRNRNAYKRGGGQVELALEELEGCLTSGETPEDKLAKKELLRSLNRFLGSLPETERNVFVCRYWYLDPIADIGNRFGFSKSKVTSMLHRTRGKLRKHLEKEGY